MRFSKVAAAITVGILLVTTPMLGALSASATPVGYVGSTADTAAFDEWSGDRVLALMTEDVAYTDTLAGPEFGPNVSWCWSISSGALPDGISMTTPYDACTRIATFSGTPTESGDFAFQVRLIDSTDGPTFYLNFEGTIASSKSPTTTTLTIPEVAPYDSIQLSATVAGNPATSGTPTGSVEFRDQNNTLLDTGVLTACSTTVTADIDRAEVGRDLEVTAVYLGDTNYQGSSSEELDIVVYAPTGSGSVTWNGTAVTDATVRLFRMSDDVVVDEDDTDSLGAFVLDPGAIVTLSDAEIGYYIEVTFADGQVLYFQDGAPNIGDIEDAETTGPLDWTGPLVVARQTGPVWNDDVLATPRVGAVYADKVTATSRNSVTYSVTDGDLPSGLTLNSETGDITGTPDECSRQSQTPFPFGRGMASCDYDFTITADNGYEPSVQMRFTGTVLPDGVAPTWEDDQLDDFRAGVAVDDEVLALGDPDIVYTVTGGTLPAGVILWPTTGELSGTPTTGGPYEFTITAENDFGSIHANFEGEVAAAPELGLVLDFAAGTRIENAGSNISADGLQVDSTYTLTMFSTPRVLFTGTVGSSGGFSHLVALPADTPAGSHKLVLTGTAADGTPMSATAWFSLGADGRIGAISYTGPVGAGLAATGSEPTSALYLGGALLLLGLVVVTVRRRRTV